MFGFTDEDVEVIRKSLMPHGAKEEDLKLFLAQAHRSGLDPLSRQIYATGFKEKDRNGNYTGNIKLSIGVTIDGFRVIAERSDKYAGQDGPYWCGPEGEWKDVWLANEPPTACKVGVLRKDFVQPLWAVAKFKGYTQGTTLWNKIPEQMIAKCAEMLALRKAFPNLLGGIYGKEELGHEPEQVEESPASVQQPAAKTEKAPEPPKTASGSNKGSVGQKPAAGATKQEPAKDSPAPPSKVADGAVKEGPEDKAAPGGGPAATEPASPEYGNGLGEQPPFVQDEKVTIEDLMSLLHFGQGHGFSENEISDWIVKELGIPEDDFLSMSRNQLAQCKYQFGKRKPL